MEKIYENSCDLGPPRMSDLVDTLKTSARINGWFEHSFRKIRRWRIVPASYVES